MTSTTQEWSILGARQGIDDHGMSDKELRLLQPGDELTTIWYMASFEGEDDFEPYTAGHLHRDGGHHFRGDGPA